MIKTNNLKTISKKLIAMFLAILMAFSSFASVDLSAFASSFSESYLGSTGHTRIKIGGNDAFCIHYGTNSSHSGDISASTSAWEYWSNFSSSKQNKIESIIAYGYDSSAHPSGLKYSYVNNSSDYVYFGIQMAIWYVACGVSRYHFSDSYATGSTAIAVYNDCLSNGIEYNPTGDETEFKNNPLKLTAVDTATKDKVSNLSDINVEDWTITSVGDNLTAKWYDSDGNSPASAKTDRVGLYVSTDEDFSDTQKITLTSENYYYNVTKSKCYKPSAQQVIVATGINTQTATLKVKCDIEYASLRIVKRDDDGSKIRSGIRYRIYTDRDDAIANNAYVNGELNDTVVKGVWVDDNDNTHAYLETDETGRVTSESVLEVGTTYYIRECGYYDAATGDYIELTSTNDSGDDAEVEVISNDDSAYVTSSYYRKTKAITITADDAGEVIRIGNAGNKIKDEDRSTDDYDANWVNIRKRGDIKIIKTDEDNNPIGGITFMLTDGADTNLIDTTDSNGVLYFTNVKTGSYQLIEYPSDNYKIEYDSNGNITAPICTNGNKFYDVSSYYGVGTIAVDVTVTWDGNTSYSVKDSVNHDGTGYDSGSAVELGITNKLIKRGDLMITKLQENGSAFERVTRSRFRLCYRR